MLVDPLAVTDQHVVGLDGEEPKLAGPSVTETTIAGVDAGG
jgi:hypothetical protein